MKDNYCSKITPFPHSPPVSPEGNGGKIMHMRYLNLGILYALNCPEVNTSKANINHN